MDRVREVLSRRRGQLVDRWHRQLRAAADAGFALDEGTRLVLPDLLDATERALVRRFRPLEPGARAHAAEARRAAIQCSLLADFLFDAVLEAVPGMDAIEQRLLSEALAHAAVEVLVGAALQREQDRRRRDGTRLARLTHELRNSATTAALALDLLRQRGALREDRTVRALERSLAKLRNGIEDTILDEALQQRDLRFSRVKLLPVLTGVQSAAAELGAIGKKLTVLLDDTPAVLQVRGDPRVVAPAVRGVFRAAVQVARTGATIRFGASKARSAARVAVSVNECARTRNNRLADLPCLTLARKAARAHGGSLVARYDGGAGCEFRLDFPSLQPQ